MYELVREQAAQLCRSYSYSMHSPRSPAADEMTTSAKRRNAAVAREAGHDRVAQRYALHLRAPHGRERPQHDADHRAVLPLEAAVAPLDRAENRRAFRIDGRFGAGYQELNLVAPCALQTIIIGLRCRMAVDFRRTTRKNGVVGGCRMAAFLCSAFRFVVDATARVDLKC